MRGRPLRSGKVQFLTPAHGMHGQAVERAAHKLRDSRQTDPGLCLLRVATAAQSAVAGYPDGRSAAAREANSQNTESSLTRLHAQRVPRGVQVLAKVVSARSR